MSLELIIAFAKTLLFSFVALPIVFTLLWKRIQLLTFKSYFLAMLHILNVLVPLYFVAALKVWRKKAHVHQEVLCLILHKNFSWYIKFPIRFSSGLLNVWINRAWDSMKLCVCYCIIKVSWKSGLPVLIFGVLNIIMWPIYDSLQVLC